jgi:hypothetical protein
VTSEALAKLFPSEVSEKSHRHVQAQIRRHGANEAIRKARVYGEGLVEGLSQSPEQSKAARKDRIMQNFGSLDGSCAQRKGRQAFSLGTLFSSLLETTGSYVDYVHTRNFPHQVAKSENDEWFYHPGIESGNQSS